MYLIPRPREFENRAGAFCLHYRSRIVLSPAVRENGIIFAGILKKCIGDFCGMTPAATAGEPAEGDIFLVRDTSLAAQEYTLLVEETGVRLSGGDDAGVLYAVQTFCQMVEQSGGVIGCAAVADRPELLHRGYYLDQTRGRVLTLEQLKRTVDRLCRYKINEFQLYIEHTYLFQGLSEMWREETPLTAEEILELDRYCRERCVELVPSLSSFGHLYMLLSTKTHGDLCELEESCRQPFSFLDRMRHHTVNVTDGRVLPLIKGMIGEYMALFSSDKFNLCADETFDLGKGKAKALADEKGVHRIYIDYVKELCTFLVENGKQPMFWGDVICGEPELIRELPEEVVCLTWGYAPDQRDYESRVMAETGVKQYLCPGVAGWNQWMNLIGNSYQNIVRMCSYARKYGAIGILNTDWGDFGHINHPEYSVPGLIYGAAFSWNSGEIPFEEMNRQIARVEYHDTSEALVNQLAQIPEHCLFSWHDAVLYYEVEELGEPEEVLRDLDEKGVFQALLQTPAVKDGENRVKTANRALAGLAEQIRGTAGHMDSSTRGLTGACDVTIDGIRIWNDIGVFLAKRRQGEQEEACGLAERLEVWFMHYKEQWRATSRESDLARIGKIVFWYADLLRGRERLKRRECSC